jgi:hypothetical protein
MAAVQGCVLRIKSKVKIYGYILKLRNDTLF